MNKKFLLHALELAAPPHTDPGLHLEADLAEDESSLVITITSDYWKTTSLSNPRAIVRVIAVGWSAVKISLSLQGDGAGSPVSFPISPADARVVQKVWNEAMRLADLYLALSSP